MQIVANPNHPGIDACCIDECSSTMDESTSAARHNCYCALLRQASEQVAGLACMRATIVHGQDQEKNDLPGSSQIRSAPSMIEREAAGQGPRAGGVMVVQGCAEHRCYHLATINDRGAAGERSLRAQSAHRTAA